jgi:hypothetical protein
MTLINKHISSLSLVALLFCLLSSAPRAHALDLATYADNSLLAEGNWVKVSIDHTDVYLLTTVQLKQMGFNDPSKVRVYGYGAKRLPDKLDSTYIDDLPETPSLQTDRGLLFYAQGPVTFTYTAESYRPVNNPFTTLGYYFLSDRETPNEAKTIEKIGRNEADNPATYFWDVVYHEVDQTSLGATGHALAGEDFVYTSSRTFNFTLTDRVENLESNVVCSFYAKSDATSYVTLSVDGVDLNYASSDQISSTSSSYIHYRESVINKVTTFNSSNIKVGVRYNSTGSVSAANLNYLAITYARSLNLTSTPLQFTLDSTGAKLSSASSNTVVWDVTDPLNVMQMNASLNGSELTWRNDYTGRRQYVAFNTNGQFSSPTYVGNVENANLHATEVPDMVIFTVADWATQARQLAKIHENSADSLKVAVITQDQVFNEFSSGSPDVNAFRKMLKMLYDRSTDERTLRYACFFGRGSYDNRQLTDRVTALNYPMMPIWQTDAGDSDNSTYNTDDIFAFLLDNSGQNLGSDKYCIAVGRMPVTSVTEAKNAISKIEDYQSLPYGNWRNRIMLIADDQDSGVHMSQTEAMWNNMLNNGGSDINYTKLYIDAYERQNSTYPEAREAMFRTLDEGVAWLTFIGHANTTSWTHESLLTYTDINNLYLKYIPALYAATCEFLRVDDYSTSAAEIMWKLQGGGAISILSACRPVFIDQNGNLSASFGRHIFERDSQGRYQAIGDIVKNAKNDYRVGSNSYTSSNENKLRYILVGDPAMRLITPPNRVVVDTVNGIDVDNIEEDPLIKANQIAQVEGHVVDATGQLISDYDGTISATLYDAETSITTLGNGDEGVEFVFDQQGDRLTVGSDSIIAGQFTVKLPTPTDITNNYRPAALSLYARPRTSTVTPFTDAVGMFRDLYVFGYDDTTPADTIAPQIKAIYMNHPTFRNGGTVNTSPTLIAEIFDNRGINVATSGIGRQMTLQLDDSKTYADVAQYYRPATDGTASGTISYPFEDLTEGAHTLRLRIFDNGGNYDEQYVDFFVKDGVAPHLYDVYTDVNPASTEANFYLSHDRPDTTIEVTLTVYNLLGQPVWSQTSSARSDLYLSYPITWNLTDNAGRRVVRGIYIYRAQITEDGNQSQTLSHKLAVTAQ